MLNGINPLAYVGVNPYTPPAMYQLNRAPTGRDNAGFQIGDFWMDETNNDLWYLAKKNIAGVQDALWVLLNNGANLETLTGDVGGAVGPDGARNINTLGTAGQILVTGNPGTNTLTWSLAGASAIQYTEDVGVAVPVANNLNIFGIGGITTSGAGDTVTITNDGTIATQYDEDTGSAVPALGILNILGTGGITTSGAGNTVTITNDGTIATSYPTDAGTAIPAGGVLNIIADIANTNSGATVEFTGVGNTVTLNVSDATSNTLIGLNAGNAVFNHASATSNTGVGVGVLQALTTGDENCAYGANSLNDLTTGGTNTALGSNVLSTITSGATNIGIGRNAGSNYTGSESNNIVISGFGRVGESNVIRIGTDLSVVGNENIFIGHGNGTAAFTFGTASLNVGIGHSCFSALTTGAQNTAVGDGSQALLTTGLNNSSVGISSFASLTTGSNNTTLGGGFLVTTGSNNVLIGNRSGTAAGAGSGITTGNYNVIVGTLAGNAYTSSESSNILIGEEVAGTVGESNKCRIGNGTGTGQGQLNKTFIAGIRGITTDVNDAIAVLIDSAGQLGTVSSSIRYKENVLDMDDYSSGLLELRPVTFNYKDKPGYIESGLIAEEVAEVLPELVVFKDGEPETVKYHLLVNYLINELQKLEKRVTELENS